MNRKRWYELPRKKPGAVLLQKITGRSLRSILNLCEAEVDNNFYEVFCENKDVVKGLGMFLNSAWSFIQRELIGRANLGDGALKVEGIDWKKILVPNRKALLKIKKDAGEAFEKLCRRTIKDIKTEAKRKDRIKFEKAVLKSLGMPEELASQILKEVVGLVEERHLLPKLRSSKKKKRFEHDI